MVLSTLAVLGKRLPIIVFDFKPYQPGTAGNGGAFWYFNYDGSELIEKVLLTMDQKMQNLMDI
jgi:hypothetical protein